MSLSINKDLFIRLPYYPSEQLYVKEKKTLGKVEIGFDFPLNSYNKSKIKLIPFNDKLSNNGRFETLDDAMTFIYYHCMQHHNEFTKNLVFSYIKMCQVFDTYYCGYITLERCERGMISCSYRKIMKMFVKS